MISEMIPAKFRTIHGALLYLFFVYVGSRRGQRRRFPLTFLNEDERIWRQRQATEMEDVCRDMLQQGLHLSHVVPVISSRDLAGGWTEGAWLYLATK